MYYKSTVPACVSLVALALVDWAMTMDALYMKAATEANPAMRWIMHAPPWESLLVKMAAVTLGGVFLVITGETRGWARQWLYILAIVYLVLILWECLGRLYIF